MSKCLDTSTHVMCGCCHTYIRWTAEGVYNFFSSDSLCTPELLESIRTPGINVIFWGGCPNCRPGIYFCVTTTEPRDQMH